jgi:hypothetical protein
MIYSKSKPEDPILILKVKYEHTVIDQVLFKPKCFFFFTSAYEIIRSEETLIL